MFDSIDMLRNSSGRQTYEILLHHITVKKKQIKFKIIIKIDNVLLFVSYYIDYWMFWYFNLSWSLYWLLCD